MKFMSRMLSHLLVSETGSTAVHLAVLSALIAIVSLAALSSMWNATM